LQTFPDAEVAVAAFAGGVAMRGVFGIKIQSSP
jgi:hypothetical protein